MSRARESQHGPESLGSMPLEYLGFSPSQEELLRADGITVLSDLFDFGADLRPYLASLGSGPGKNLERILRLVTFLRETERANVADEGTSLAESTVIAASRRTRPDPEPDSAHVVDACAENAELRLIPLRQLGLPRALVAALRRQGVLRLGDLVDHGPDLERYLRTIGGVGAVKARAACDALSESILSLSLDAASSTATVSSSEPEDGPVSSQTPENDRIEVVQSSIPISLAGIFARDELRQDLVRLLEREGGQDKRELIGGLISLGWEGLTTTDVNSVLYQHQEMFARDGSTPPLWTLAAGYDAPASAAVGAGPSLVLSLYEGPSARAWQQEALDAWLDASRRGVVEAVTGTGKTAVGILAAADAVARGRRVLVIVPGVDLLDQWHAKLTSDLPSVRIGRLGNRCEDSLVDHDVVVSTVQSAYRWVMLPAGHEGLLIADEVHHYGAKQYSEALEEAFDERLVPIPA